MSSQVYEVMNKEKIVGLLKLFRPKNALMSTIGVLVGWFSVSREISLSLLLACLVPPLILMAGNAINDYFDAPIDAINKPNRPIPSGKISMREAFMSYVILSFLGIFVSSFLGVEEAVIAIFFSIAWYAYARWIKALGIVGNALVSLGVAFTLIFGGLAAGTVDLKVVLFSIIAFLSNMSREIVKTIEDIEGDRAYGLHTVAVLLGLRGAGVLASVFSILSSAVAIYPYLTGMVGIPYLTLTIIISIPLLLYAAILSLKVRSQRDARKISNYMKLSMFFGLLGMLADPLI